MIDAKYGLKYSFPHSVIHIVDNSAYDGELPLTVADDPSLYTSIVVTGSPMGEDNKLIYITRSDIINKAYGMQGLDKATIEMYGQSITYPAALINQGVPVRLLRVTAEDATYAFNCILVEWRYDDTTGIFHVRFRLSSNTESSTGLPPDIRLDAYKTTDKLNNALVRGWKNDEVVDSDGTKWKRRVFINNISAGRGDTYNKFITSIDKISQSRRPANVKYTFNTIDTETDLIVESFDASLVNYNNGLRADAIEEVNSIVKRRESGSSLLIPYVNEDAIHEIYSDYMARLAELKEYNAPEGEREYLRNIYNTMNINIFDIIYGRYIYNGDQDVLLPHYQVDMPNSDIELLDPSYRFNVIANSDGTVPTDELDEYIWKNTIAVHDTDEYRIGDIFLSSNGTGSSKKFLISILAMVNQFSGNTTTISAENLRPLTVSGDNTIVDMDKTDGVYNKPSRSITQSISYKYSEVVSGTTPPATADDWATAIKAKLATETGIYDRIVVVTILDDGNNTSYNNQFYLFYIEDSTNNKIYFYNQDLIYKALDFGGYSSNVSNVIARPYYDGTAWIKSTDNAVNKLGYAVLGIASDADDTAYHNALVQVNYRTYPDTLSSNNVVARKVVTEASEYRCIYGAAPANIDTNSDIYQKQYDMIGYTNGNLLYSCESGIVIKNGGSGYAVGDTVILNTAGENSNANTVLRITEIGDSGTVTAFEIMKSENEPNKVYDATVTTKNTIEIRSYSEDTSVTSSNFDEKKSDLYVKSGENYVKVSIDAVFDENVTYYTANPNEASGFTVDMTNATYSIYKTTGVPVKIDRYIISGNIGSIYRKDKTSVDVPADYYSGTYGLNLSSEYAGVPISNGSNGFFQQYKEKQIDSTEFKWRYSALLVKAFRGEIDRRILSPTRCPAKFLFDFGANTVVGQTILPYIKYTPTEIVQSSTIFTDDEKEALLLNDPESTFLQNITEFDNESDDIDVKQAMYDLMEYRCYQGIPEDKRPVGPGSGLSLHLDSGVTDGNTAALLKKSFVKRFTNPNASWDIGGYVSSADGVSYTYVKKIVEGLFTHIKTESINKPYVGRRTAIQKNEYISFFPDVDATDWEERESLYTIGGNAWIMNNDGSLQRRSQRTLFAENSTSDMLQESNMRTLSQLTYLLQNKIDSYLLEYNDDSILRSMEDDCNITFGRWIGRLVDDLSISFKRDINTDGGEIVVCNCEVTFRGLILRVPIIVNIQRRRTSET
jgi:hypothetical protein